MTHTLLDNLASLFRRRLRSALIQAGISRVLLVGLILLPPILVLDWLVHLAVGWRVVALGGYLATLAATAWFTLILPLRQRWSNTQIFARLDEVLPAGDGTLVELHELLIGEGIEETARPLGQSLVKDAAEQLAPLAQQARQADAIHRGGVSRWRNAAVFTVVLFIAAAVPLAAYLSIGAQRLFNPLSLARWPHRTTIALNEPPGGFSVPQLESLEIRADLSGIVPTDVTLAYRAKSGGYWIKEKLPVRPDGSVRYTFPEVREPIRFYLAGGDDSTDPQIIRVVERPYLKQVTVHYDYPDYAGLPNRDVDGGQVFALEGTRIRLSFVSSMPLKRGAIHFDGKPSEPLPLTSDTTFEKSLVLTSDASYTVELFEKNGFREARPERYDIRVSPYNPPQVQLLSPGENMTCTPQAAIPVSFRASDEFKLKKVEFLYQVGDAPASPLSDRITGPLVPGGKNLDAHFTWDLRKTELPATGVIQYFVRATDVNPTGRGVTESPKLQIKLVKPSEFHFDTFEQAKQIEAEARLAWENQYGAWKAAAEFSQKGTGKEDDPAWQEIKEKQEAAIRSAGAMETALRLLIGRYEQNDMAREFMAGRLAVITELLHRVNATDHPAIAAAFDSARPRTDSDAGRLKELRGAALARCADHQKLAVLCLERLLTRLFDWRDLQTTLIRDTLLAEEQEEVLALTQQLAPKTLGWEMEDLANDVQDKLLTLGKRQRTLFDVEGELEKELEFQIYRAQTQKRKNILDPLRAAYRGLRDTRVNDNLKLAAGKIENNQAFQIIPNQKAVLQLLSIVKGGLIQAGQKVDPEEPITLAMTPGEVLDVQPKPKTEEVATTAPAATEPSETTAVSPEDLLANLSLGGDPVTAAINAAWEANDAVLSRTRYLSQNSTAGEMPRFVKLKKGILLNKQAFALRALDRAIDESQKANAAPVRQALQGVRDEFQQSQALIEAGQYSPLVQQLESDEQESLDDLRRRFLPLQKSVKEAADEIKHGNGSDAFNLKYLIRDKDLETAVAILEDLNEFQLAERDVVRKLDRLAKLPAKEGLAMSIEKTNRSRASAAQRRAAALLAGLGQKQSAFSSAVAAAVGKTGLAALVQQNLGATADAIDAGATDVPLHSTLNAAAESCAQVARSLKDLLGEREKPAVAAVQPTTQPKAMSLAEWQKLRTPEALRAQLKADTKLPPRVRDIMLRSLEKDFPPKYRDLLAAYYASFVAGEKN